MQKIRQFFSWYSKQKLISKLLIGFIGLMAACCLLSVPIAILSPSSLTPTEESTAIANAKITQPVASTETSIEVATLAPTDTPEPTSTPVPTETPNPNLIKSGTYIVSVDIQPGIYKGFAGEGLFDSCYWERLKDLTGNFESILANNNANGQFYVEVKNGDYAFKTDCEMVRLESIPLHAGDYSPLIKPGTYLIGSDIRPGTYRGQAGSDFTESCYWQRVRSVDGELGSILANDNATGQYYVQVLPSDFALQTACELEWVGE